MLADGRDQVGVVTVPFRTRHDELRSGGERPEDLPDGDVEGERRLLEHPVGGAQVEGRLPPQQPVADRAMGVDDPFGPPSRAGGVDHVGRAARQGEAGRIGVDLAGRPGLPAVKGKNGDRSVRHPVAPPILRQDGDRRGVGQHEGEPVRRISGIERQVGGPGLHDAEDSHHHLDRALHEHPHHRLRPHPPAAQGVGYAIGAAVELVVGEPLAASGEGRRLGRARDLGFDQELQVAEIAGQVEQGRAPRFHSFSLQLSPDTELTWRFNSVPSRPRRGSGP